MNDKTKIRKEFLSDRNARKYLDLHYRDHLDIQSETGLSVSTIRGILRGERNLASRSTGREYSSTAKMVLESADRLLEKLKQTSR